MTEPRPFPSAAVRPQRSALRSSVARRLAHEQVDRIVRASTPHPIVVAERFDGEPARVVPVSADDVLGWAADTRTPELVGIVALGIGVLADHQGDLFGLRWWGDPDDPAWATDDRPTPLLADLVSARLGHPDRPPERDTTWFWVLRWFEELAGTPAGRLRRDEIVRRHPGVDIGDPLPASDAGATAALVAAHRDLVVARDWSSVHLDARLDPRDRHHRAASVLGPGAFGRWVAAVEPSLMELVRPLIDRLDPGARRVVGDVLCHLLLAHRLSAAP